MEQQNQKNEKKKNKRILLLLLLLLLAATAGGLYYYFSNKTEPVQVVSGDYLPDSKGAKKMTDAELKAAEQKAVDESKFNMVIKSVAVFETGESEGSLYIQNPVENGYPINVVIRLDETGEQVYSSGAIQPGYEITSAKLDKTLAKGDHPATATFDIYDAKTKQKRGQVQAGITLQINN
ncbi:MULTISPECIES: hypothetical protein [unclassified Enterococcus]|uniref:hypothetical protein n=1 Tax=unclassified Enterococcus TaxID=2608891 RepID=UPI001CE16D1D|nr:MULTISPECIES: hypothetical protein [unclassified Enterococcus]MCA5013891.1 hypothetical protein [Enterococcus sp. S23]MCA5017335.1 hypothetical protein [Enterococcus sp. S22(2020)]